MRVGLFGGTFDPVHAGHLDVARAAHAALALDHVILVPARVPPHRAAPHASPAHRFAMAALAVAGDPRMSVSDFEMDASGPSYTEATLDRLGARGVDVRGLFLVAGADAFADIRSWRGYPALLDRCHFIVVSRPQRPAPSLRAALADLAPRMIDAPHEGGCAVPAQPSIFLVDKATADVSSTGVRARLANGASLAGDVPPAVEAHIRANRLYGAGGAPWLGV